MRFRVLCAFISLVPIITSVFASNAYAGTKFTSTYTDLQKDCEDKFRDSEEGEDMPVICKGPGGYVVHVDFSACCEHVRVEGKKNLELRFPEQRFVTAMNRKLEWRLADGKPFAVIFRVDKYKGDITLSPGKTTEILIVKGLNGFTNIDHEVELKLHTSPNHEARRLTDQDYIHKRQTNGK